MIVHCLKIGSLLLVIFNLLLPLADKKEIQAQEETSRQTVYQPPKNEDENKNEQNKKEAEDENENEILRAVQRTPGGSRGGKCNSLPPQVVTLIVPEDHVPLTVSSHPTFWFHLSQEVSLPIRFTLLEPRHKPIYTLEFSPNKSGLIALTLPETVPPLAIGREYRWSASIICNRQKPSQNLYAQAWIKRVASPPLKAEGRKELCNLAYAQSGIWYDALACDLSRSNQANFNPLINRDIFSLLLKDIGLEHILNSQDWSFFQYP